MTFVATPVVVEYRVVQTESCNSLISVYTLAGREGGGLSQIYLLQVSPESDGRNVGPTDLGSSTESECIMGFITEQFSHIKFQQF